MGLVSGIVVFFMIWWTVLFAVLPWGVRAPDQVEPGHVPSAPAQPRILQKFLITTAITVVIWLLVYALIQSDLISFRRWAETM